MKNNKKWGFNNK